jgi:hypothetical protein
VRAVNLFRDLPLSCRQVLAGFASQARPGNSFAPGTGIQKP